VGEEGRGGCGGTLGTVFFSGYYPFTRFLLQFCKGPTAVEGHSRPKKYGPKNTLGRAEIRYYLPG
jgi:hypothetical protein